MVHWIPYPPQRESKIFTSQQTLSIKTQGLVNRKQVCHELGMIPATAVSERQSTDAVAGALTGGGLKVIQTPLSLRKYQC